LAKENERKLCSNAKCTQGVEGKRKVLGVNMVIIQIAGFRYCSKFCQAQGSLR
jgi:hypothetical protein